MKTEENALLSVSYLILL